jgi:phosphate transport system substrate-binding protein
VRDLNLGQLRRVFSGDIRNWKDVGGADAPIEVLTHDGATGTYEAWKERVLGENRVVLPEAEVTGTDAMLLAIAAKPHAIGYVAYVSLNPTVRALSVNGIAPTQANIASETFPVTRSLKFVTITQPDAGTRRFVDFCLDPEGGGRIQKELGMIPYTQPAPRVANSVNKG